MFSKKLLLVLALTMFSGSLAGTVTAKKKLCIPCTGYCKTHPNAPRCNYDESGGTGRLTSCPFDGYSDSREILSGNEQ
jgi:hypothetical protein